VAEVKPLLEVLLRPYAQILFSKDLRTGALVLLAVAVFPWLAVATLLSLAVASLVVLLFGLGDVARLREGTHGCTAVLATMALGVFDPGAGHPLALAALAAPVAVLLTASFEAAFADLALPTHSFPFIGATWLIHLAARSFPARGQHALELLTPLSWIPETWLTPSWLDVPAALLFLNGPLAGAFVIAAIAIHSRIALILGAVGQAAVLLMRLWLRDGQPWSLIDIFASFNGILAAMAIGGVWFVPQLWSILMAGFAATVATLVTYALAPLTSMVYLPVLSVPFSATVHLFLMAARRREADRRPHSAVPLERPEDMLARHLVRIRRFGDAAWLPFRLPFRGEWIVTQAYDGAHTHKGLWRHGLDFEGVGKDGEKHRGEGAALADYHCYGLPVVAAGFGTVSKVVDGVEDNIPGQINTHDNWGNAIVIQHGIGLYSVYAHLKPKTIRVRPGEVITAGQEIARCGNSGRSPVPHLHFQIQRAAELGSPTMASHFSDVVHHDDDGFEMRSLVIPSENEVVRPVLRDESIARALAFAPGSEWKLRHEGTNQTEVAKVEVDLLGRRALESDRARLYIEPYDAGFVVVDFVGDSGSLLRFVAMALARVPFDKAPSLRWKDALSRRLFLRAPLRAVADLVAMVAPTLGATSLLFSYERQGGRLVIRGDSDRWGTRAELSLTGGDHRLEVRHDGRREVVELQHVPAEEPARPMAEGRRAA
jgi:murein DD-endopeptidase MepM/ murein hydrolase activator NlpD/urea transporter